MSAPAQAVLLQQLRAQRQKIDAAIAAIVALDGDSFAPIYVERPAGQRGRPRRGDVARILAIVNASPQGVRCVDVGASLGKESEAINVYLRRLLRDGDIEQPEKGGRYFPRTPATAQLVAP